MTNNAREFLHRYRRRAPLHAGLIPLVAASGLSEQRLAFKAALRVLLSGSDLTNAVLHVERDGERIRARLETWPA